MCDWKPYLNGRLIRDAGGFYVIVPGDFDEAPPFGCPVCDTLLRSQDDEMAWREFGCCELCALRWAHPRRDAWRAGWRPSPEQITADLASRAPMIRHFGGA